MRFFMNAFVLLLIVSLGVRNLGLLISPAYASAASPWTQTDWTSGYSSSSNINTSVSGQLTLSQTSSWYSTNWLYRRKITFDNASQAENLTDFPVLVKLNSSRINYNNTQNSGQDIRFTDSDGTTLLSYEIEKWDESGESFVWVKVPQIDASSSTDNIYMYYGNSVASDGQTATSVWDSNFKLVQHLKESGNGALAEYKDSTSNTNNGQGGGGISSSTPTSLSSGKVDGAQVFDGSDDFIQVAGNAGLQPTSVTVEVWVKTSTTDVTASQIINMREAYILQINPSGVVRFYIYNGSNWNQRAQSTSTVTDNQWHHLVGVKDASNNLVKLYIDGIQVASATSAGTISYTLGNDLFIGKHASGGTTFDYNGSLDEARISSSVRSAAWVAATYKTQVDTFNNFSGEEAGINYNTLISSIFDTQHDISANWGTLTYTATTPTNTSVSVKVRTSNSSTMEAAPDFSTCTAIASDNPIGSNSCVSSSHRYIQYQVILGNTDSVSTPTFQDISIYFTNPPHEFSLDGPAHNAYISASRPTFSFTSSTETSGLSSYAIEIDNGDTGDFSFTAIPILRSEEYDVPRYNARYEHFTDDDPHNNTILVQSKSSKDWGGTAHDGILKEGKRTWMVKARDNSGNERVLSRTLLVDRTPPTVQLKAINDRVYAPIVATTDTTPTIYGAITDELAGDTAQSRVASGPHKIDVQIEKSGGNGKYQPYRMETDTVSDLYYTSSSERILDNSQQTSDKYASFAYTPSTFLPYGIYKFTITATDRAGNSKSASPVTISITTLSQITIPQEKKIIKEETRSLNPKQQQQLKNELEITKPIKTLPTQSPILSPSKQKDTRTSFFNGIIDYFFSGLFNN